MSEDRRTLRRVVRRVTDSAGGRANALRCVRLR